MKKIILSLIAVMACMSISAQVIKVYENGKLKDTYTNSSTNPVKVVFEEAPAAPATTGTAKATLTVGSSTETDVQWVQLWENGPKWAVFNVGATSVSEYGGYYYWGYTNMTSYSSSTSDIQYGTDDTAKNLWGDNWQMPKSEDLENLLSTDYTDGGKWKSDSESGYGVAGLLFTGKSGTAYANNSVFFPAAGYYITGGSKVSLQGSYGAYWSSTPDGSDYAYLLDFDSDYQLVESNNRNYGYSVRAVLK